MRYPVRLLLFAFLVTVIASVARGQTGLSTDFAATPRNACPMFSWPRVNLNP